MDPAVEVLEYLAGGGLVVTANPRAARTLRRAYADWQRLRGAQAWASPTVADWSGWLGELWAEYAFSIKDAPLLLSSLQERWLWKRVVQSQEEAKLVVSVDPLTALAQQAYSLLSDYDAQGRRQFPWSTRGEDSLSDPEAFRRWAFAFDGECRRRRAISHSQLTATLAEQIHKGSIAVPPEIRLLGFDRLTPGQQKLLDALQEMGSVITRLVSPEAAAPPRLILAQNRRDEIATCAAWLRKLLLKDPSLRIAVIVPDLEAARGEIERTFRRMLAPESMNILAKPTSLPFEFSLGVPLATLPVVRAALLLLRWIDSPLMAEELSWLLLSGFVAVTDTDPLLLSEIDFRLRGSGLMQQEISLSNFAKQRQQQANDAGKKLVQRLSNMSRIARVDRPREALEWTELAQAMLSTAGWPGPAEPDSIEFQARKKWARLLESMATLGFDDYRLSYREFLSFLERHATEAIFSPESQDAQVQVMGPAESSGQSFDAVWFLGAEEGTWPRSGRPHPLLPLAVQRAAGMPHSTAATDWDLARTTTLRVASSAPVSIFSYSGQNEDGALRPSTLLRELPECPEALPSDELRAELALESEPPPLDRTEKVPDSAGIPWPSDRTVGGFAVLKRQSACPFQSFAAARLFASELEEVQWGLSALQRGDLLHSVLERLWSQAPAEGRLHSLSDLHSAIHGNTLDAMLTTHIEEVFKRYPATQEADAWTTTYLQAEKERLHMVLTSWLMYEADRQPFTVEACEKAMKDVYVGDLRLDLRMDRVDLLSDATRLLIDYKTGEVSTSQWTVPRLEEPQLPLYATYGGLEDVQGLVFAQIRAGKMKFVGHVQNPKEQLFAHLGGTAALVKKPLDETMRNAWKEDLLELANGFVRGEASVDPKRYPQTCKHCAFPALCRVAETAVPHLAVDTTYSGNSNGEDERND
ncbi:MAG TPA: PD-(D/E)XK nuclease family protein [Acidisarcina sp.]|nr:PD-(D/E)XK nuclease family protein [Acidisarcina sp.]